jgi:hypothetical protein
MLRARCCCHSRTGALPHLRLKHIVQHRSCSLKGPPKICVSAIVNMLGPRFHPSYLQNHPVTCVTTVPLSPTTPVKHADGAWSSLLALSHLLCRVSKRVATYPTEASNIRIFSPLVWPPINQSMAINIKASRPKAPKGTDGDPAFRSSTVWLSNSRPRTVSLEHK